MASNIQIQSTVIILIIARAFIRDTAFFKVGGGRLLEV